MGRRKASRGGGKERGLGKEQAALDPTRPERARLLFFSAHLSLRTAPASPPFSLHACLRGLRRNPHTSPALSPAKDRTSPQPRASNTPKTAPLALSNLSLSQLRVLPHLALRPKVAQRCLRVLAAQFGDGAPQGALAENSKLDQGRPPPVARGQACENGVGGAVKRAPRGLSSPQAGAHDSHAAVRSTGCALPPPPALLTGQSALIFGFTRLHRV